MTEFKNASSDMMKNATKTFMETKDLVSRVKHTRSYFPVVGVGAFDCFHTNYGEKITTAWIWERSEHWKEQPDR